MERQNARLNISPGLSPSIVDISIRNCQRKYRVPERRVLSWTRRILQMKRYESGEIGILWVNDRQIRRYNRDYRHQDKATDVLAFPMREGVGGELHPQFLGDVMISLETAKRDAALSGRRYLDHLLMLLIHGTLHLMGYDHEQSDREAQRMKRQERRLFKKLTEGV